jgi:glycosyltransferase involved in cell wall biosynthesis
VNHLPVSAVVIAYNDEPNMRACLESTTWADEIIVVDSHSTDATERISREFTGKVYQHDFHGFGRLRNEALAHATHDWVFSLDTDERATPELREEIRRVLAGGPAADAYFVPRKNYFLGRWIKHCGWFPDYRQPQLFRKSRLRYREELVHESFDLDGKIGYLTATALQYPFRNIDHYLAKQERYSDLMARRMVEQGRAFSWHQLISHPCFTFLKMYVGRKGCLDGVPGLILSGLYAYYTFIKYARFWELQLPVGAEGLPPAPVKPSSRNMNATHDGTRRRAIRIAAVIITKDEAHNIADCLESVRWADELIVVDAESRDRTVELAKPYTSKVFVRPWPGYGPQKNFGIDQADADWILVVDADERVTEGLRREIEAALETAPPADIGGYEIPRRNFFYGKWIEGGGLYPDYQLRLFRKTAGRYDDVKLHENLTLSGRRERLREPFDHYSMPTVNHHIRKMMRYTTLGADEKLKRVTHISGWVIATHHLGTILKTLFSRGGYRDGVHGLVVAMFAGLHTFVKYAKAWERVNVRRDA